MFFTPEANMPEGLGFRLYDLTHLMWLGIFVTLCAVSVIIYKKLNIKYRNIMRIGIAVTVITLETAKNIVAFAVGDFGIGHMPFHLCGINVLLITFCILNVVKPLKTFYII